MTSSVEYLIGELFIVAPTSAGRLSHSPAHRSLGLPSAFWPVTSQGSRVLPKCKGRWMPCHSTYKPGCAEQNKQLWKGKHIWTPADLPKWQCQALTSSSAGKSCFFPGCCCWQPPTPDGHGGGFTSPCVGTLQELVFPELTRQLLPVSASPHETSACSGQYGQLQKHSWDKAQVNGRGETESSATFSSERCTQGCSRRSKGEEEAIKPVLAASPAHCVMLQLIHCFLHLMLGLPYLLLPSACALPGVSGGQIHHRGAWGSSPSAPDIPDISRPAGQPGWTCTVWVSGSGWVEDVND